jgi:hypothetical protein
MPLIWGNREAKYFSQYIWTTQITLNRLTKLDFKRDFSARGRSRKAESSKNCTDFPVGQKMQQGAMR